MADGGVPDGAKLAQLASLPATRVPRTKELVGLVAGVGERAPAPKEVAIVLASLQPPPMQPSRPPPPPPAPPPNAPELASSPPPQAQLPSMPIASEPSSIEHPAATSKPQVPPPPPIAHAAEVAGHLSQPPSSDGLLQGPMGLAALLFAVLISSFSLAFVSVRVVLKRLDAPLSGQAKVRHHRVQTGDADVDGAAWAHIDGSTSVSV